MKPFDYLFPLLLIVSVLRQVRGKHLTWFQLTWPVALVIWVAISYVRGFPATGSNLALVIGAAVTGTVLGVFAGVFTWVHRREDGVLIARATAATVVLWILGTIGRLVFGLYAEYGGGPAIATFSHAHGIAFSAWPAALVLMALCEVFGRTLILAARAITARDELGGTSTGFLGLPVSSAPTLRR